MAFCIKCGAKAPDVANFCPRCGTGLVAAEAASETPASHPAASAPDVEAVEIKTDEIEVASSEPIEVPELKETKMTAETEEPAVIARSEETLPIATASLAAAANHVEDAPKSKAGLFIGLTVAAIIAAGGGAYAMGLFGGAETKSTQIAAAPEVSSISIPSEPEVVEIESPETNPALSAYQAAIKTGRISDLGEFANAYPQNSLAKDAETAAFDSLKRQSTVEAYTAFIEFFPDTDMSDYAGPREETEDVFETNVPLNPSIVQPNESAVTIRSSILQRANDLEPFINQGDTDYVLSVVDEMVLFSDLTTDEATLLLELSDRVEAAASPSPPAADNAAITLNESGTAQVDITSSSEFFPTADTSLTFMAFDTAAVPLERFGAITPDEATAPGECDMAFSVNVSGSPENIVASCTDPIFIQAAKETVEEWTYSPALLAGQPVQQNGVVVKLKFHLE